MASDVDEGYQQTLKMAFVVVLGGRLQYQDDGTT
jgi:hypothetical protein